MKRSTAVAFAGLLLLGGWLPGTVGSAVAQTVVDQWTSIKRPPPPVVKSVKVDPKSTAFLILDLINSGCNARRRPRCTDGLPKVKAFLAKARAQGMPVVYSLSGSATMADVVAPLKPLGSEPHVTAHADKFVGTDLDKILKGLHVTTVITVGASAEGAVLYTASHAALLGYKVIDPIDGSFSTSWGELVTAWTLSHAPTVGDATTLTTFDKISF